MRLLAITSVTVTDAGRAVTAVREVSGRAWQEESLRQRPGHFPAWRVYKVYKL